MAIIDACPACNGLGTRTTDSRLYGERRVRRKRCHSCGHRWSTEEMPLGTQSEHDQAITTARSAIANLTALIETLEQQRDRFGPRRLDAHDDPPADRKVA